MTMKFFLQTGIGRECQIDHLVSVLEEKYLSSNSGKSYLLSYDGIVDYFKNDFQSAPKRVLAGIFMVYGWMPTIPDFFKKTVSDERQQTISELPELVRTIKQITDETPEDDIWLLIKKLKPIINNSLVGTSKFLHFVNPEIFPIWDSKVAENVYCLSTRNQIENIKNYQCYFRDLKSLRSEVCVNQQRELCSKITEALQRVFNTPMGTLSFTRAVELLCFYGFIKKEMDE